MNTAAQTSTGEPLLETTRHDRRRAAKDLARNVGYAKSGFVDRARQMAFGARDVSGPIRPVAGIDFFHPLSSSLIPRNRAPHANRGTLRRPHFDRSARRDRAAKAYAAGLVNNAKGRSADGRRSLAAYGNSSATQEAAPLLMAA